MGKRANRNLARATNHDTLAQRLEAFPGSATTDSDLDHVVRESYVYNDQASAKQQLAMSRARIRLEGLEWVGNDEDLAAVSLATGQLAVRNREVAQNIRSWVGFFRFSGRVAVVSAVLSGAAWTLGNAPFMPYGYREWAEGVEWHLTNPTRLLGDDSESENLHRDRDYRDHMRCFRVANDQLDSTPGVIAATEERCDEN